MATKVNIKFVVALAVTLMALFAGVGWVAYNTLTTSGDEYASKGDALMAQGNYDDASDMYRRAVGHDKTNIVWLNKWRESLLHVVPETQVEYLKYYRDYYLGILGTLAALQDTNVDAQRDYIDAWYRQLKAGSPSAESWQNFINQLNTVLTRLPEEDTSVKSLYRYRGLARLARLEQIESRDSERNETLADLQTALQGDPKDLESAVGVIRWRFNEWKRAHRLRRTQTADQLWNTLGEEIIKRKKQFGDQPLLLLTELQISIQRVLQLEDNPSVRVRMIQKLKNAEAPLLKAINEADPKTFDLGLLDQTYALLKPLRPTDYASVMLGILDRLAQARPNDPQLMLMRGNILNEAGKYQEAIDQLDRVVQAPDLPVSIEGLMLIGNFRSTALYKEGDATLNLLAKATDEKVKNQLLTQAKTLRSALVDRVPGGENSPFVMLLDGRIALSEDRPADAVERLKALDDLVSGKDSQVIQLLGQALVKSNLLGAARDQYERLIEINPGDVRSLMILANLEGRLQDLDAAAEHYQQVLAIVPDFSEAQLQLSAIHAVQGVIEMVSAKDADPIRVAIIRWQALMKQDPPEYEEAIAILREARRNHGDDPRLFNAMITHYNQASDAANAMAITKEAIALYPDKQRFTDWRTRLQMQSSDLSLDDRLALVDQSDASAFDKSMLKIKLLRNAGRNAEADALFAVAAKTDPDNPGVVEMQFNKAITNEEFDKARSLVATAARLNLDSVNGQLYQARLEFALGDDPKALGTLQQVVDRVPFNPLAQRLLGQTYLRLGRTAEALDALGKAFEIKPDGLLVARMYVQTLMKLRQFNEALTIVKRARKFNGADRVLTEFWLSIEEQVGDRSLALSERRARYKANPKDIQNATALVRLLFDEESWTKARAIIDQLRQDNPANLTLAILDANGHAQQGDFEAGVQVFRSLSIPDAPASPLLALGQYYIDNNKTDDAITVLKQATAAESSTDKTAELMLSELYFKLGQYDRSAPLFKAALDAGADNAAGDIARRYADALLQLKRFEDARDSLLALTGEARSNPRTNILLARASSGLGDVRAAQSFLDDAVESAPSNPAPFLARAQFNMNNPDQFEDVLQYLNQAIRLAPGDAVARQIKATVLTQNGRISEAIRELQQAVTNNPDNTDLPRLLIQLFANSNQLDQAILTAERAAIQFPTEPGWLMTAGDLYASTKSWSKAEAKYTAAYALNPTAAVAIRVAQAYLEVDPPRPQDAIALIDKHLDSDTHLSTLLLLKSQAASKMENLPLAKSLLEQSFDAAEKQADLRDWFTGLSSVFSDRLELLDFIRSQTPHTKLKPLYAVLLARLEAQDPANQDSVIARLSQIDTDAADPATLIDAYRLLGGLLYIKKQYVEAADVFRKAVALAPEDLEFNNNLAYVLARNLNDPQGALEPAKKAAQLSPSSADVLDTLGWVYFKLNQLSQAQATLNQALNNAQTDAQKTPALLHLAQTLYTQKQYDRARRNAEGAKALIERSNALKQQFGDQLEQVMKMLDTTE